MQQKLEDILRLIGLPIAIAGVIASVAFALGLPLEESFTLFGALVGLPYVIGLIVDLLKLVGVVKEGTSGQWSAALNLISIIGIAVLLKFIPDFDVTTLDARLLELAKALVLIISWIAKLFATRDAHQFYTRTLGVKKFRFQLNVAN